MRLSVVSILRLSVWKEWRVIVYNFFSWIFWVWVGNIVLGWFFWGNQLVIFYDTFYGDISWILNHPLEFFNGYQLKFFNTYIFEFFWSYKLDLLRVGIFNVIIRCSSLMAVRSKWFWDYQFDYFLVIYLKLYTVISWNGKWVMNWKCSWGYQFVFGVIS